MSTIDEIRRENLALLIAQAGGAGKLAAKIGKSPSQISQWLNASLDSKTGKPRGMRPESCREIEAAFNKPKGWMDVPQKQEALGRAQEGFVNVGSVTIAPRDVPLISWVRAGSFCETHDPFQPGDADEWLSCPTPHGPRTFALRVKGESMDGPDRGYVDGEIIFVDPEKIDPIPGKDFIFCTPDQQATFKRLIQEHDGWYLKAVNENWTPRFQKMPEGTRICGRVIGSMRQIVR
jgi:SOS-response transcriptional repressor LexA